MRCAALNRDVIHNAQNLLGQFVLLMSVAETQNGAFIGQPTKLLKLCKLTAQRYVKEGLFHSWIR
jgi:hypothetical protein